MPTYQKILCLTDTSFQGERVVQRALQMARMNNATLAVATIIDYAPGYDSCHAPFLTPQQVQKSLIKEFTAKLDRMLEKAGGPGIETIVAMGEEKPTVRDLLQSWDPELVIVGSHAAFGFDHSQSLFGQHSAPRAFDTLVVQMEQPRAFGGKLVRALASAF